MPGRSAKGVRMYTLAEKQEFVREFNLCVEWGAKTGLLRRWNLNPGVARRWVIAAKEGRLGPAASTERLNMGSQERARLVALERENERLRAKVASAEAALEIMGKAHELLDGTLRSSHENDEVPLSLMSVAEYQQWLERYKTS
jgi:transposase-like protein